MVSVEKLILERKRNGLTQETLAEKLGVSRQAISLWEREETLPSAENLRQLSELYGVSVEYLMNGDTDWPATVAVMEKPEPEKAQKKDWRKFILGGAIIALIALLVFFAGYAIGEHNESAPIQTYQVHTDALDVTDFEEGFDIKPLSTPPANTLDEEAFEGTFDLTMQ